MKKGKILLGEENSLSAIAMVSMLKGRNVELDLARNVQELMQKYHSTHYDLILLHTWLDCSLEVAQEIRAEEAALNGKFTPIMGIFASWVEDEESTAREYKKYYEAGMNDVFSQPITAENIDEILEKYIF